MMDNKRTVDDIDNHWNAVFHDWKTDIMNPMWFKGTVEQDCNGKMYPVIFSPELHSIFSEEEVR